MFIDERPGDRVYEYVLTRWSAVYRRRRAGRPDQVVRKQGTTADEWWAWIDGLATSRRVLWIISVNGSEAFNLCEGWKQAEHRGIGWGSLEPRPTDKAGRVRGPDTRPKCTMLVGPKPVILTHTLNTARVKWVSTQNYIDAPIDRIAASVGIDYPAVDFLTAGAFAYQSDPDRAAAAIDTYFSTWMTEHVAEDRGHWRETAAGLAMQFWRRKHYTNKVLVHQSEGAAKLERRGLWGGRTELFFRGSVGTVPAVMPDGGKIPAPRHDAISFEPTYKFDVRSMYVSMLAKNLFPVTLQKFFPRISLQHVRAACECRGVIADVTIETNEPIYPCRLRRADTTHREYVDGERRYYQTYGQCRVSFPVGRFQTILSGPDLQFAFRHGHIIGVRSAAAYRLEYAFRSFGKSLLASRRKARDAGNAVSEMVAKLTGNSLAGKLASRGGGWHLNKNVAAQKRWGTWIAAHLSDGPARTFRALAGIVQEHHVPDEGPRAVPSILAYLTAYGRQMLWSIFGVAGIGNVLWCDTDGLIVTVEGRDRIMKSSLYAEDEPGKLRLEGEIRSFRGWTPKHYYADGNLTLGGYRCGAWIDPSGEIRDWHSLGWESVISDPERATGRHHLRRTDLTTEPLDGGQDVNGMMTPTRLTGREIRNDAGETLV